MSEFESPLNPPSAAGSSSLREQLESLQKVMQLVLIAVLVIGGCLTVFLWRQQREMSKQIDRWEPAVKQYDTILLPLVNKLVPNLTNYARTHPDLNPILEKYGMHQAGSTPGMMPAGAPAGAKPAAPKK